MAVYKSTYCSPLLESIDPRIDSMTLNPAQTCVWLKCKVNSSNKKITGYNIRLLDADNNVIFPQGELKISPISELQNLFNDPNINSGLNGTMLYIPFFQNLENKVLLSHNALYFIPPYEANFMLDIGSANSGASWQYHSDSKTWTSANWDGYFNGGLASEGDIVFVFNADSGKGLYTIKYDAENQQSILQPYQDPEGYLLVEGDSDGYASLCGSDSGSPRIFISHGDYHDKVFYYDSDWSYTTRLGQFLWQDASGNKYNISVENDLYKWEITLYQGDGQIVSVSDPAEINYDNLSFNWYDMVLTQGSILGSTNKRIQIADDNGTLPSGEQNSPLVLQGRFVQLLDEHSRPIAERSYIRSYDASFGHVYPTEGDFQLNWINSAQKVCFYKHSNKEEAVDSSERVRLASTTNIPIYTGDSSYEEIGDQQEAEEYARMGLVRYIEQTSYETAYGINYVLATEEFVEENAVRSSREETGLIHETYQVVWFQAGDNTYSTPLLEAHLYFYEGIGTINAEDITVTYLNTEMEIDDFEINRPNELVVYFFVTKESSRPITTKVISVNIQAKNHKVWHYYKATLENVQFNNNLGLQIVDGVQTAENDLVLVKNQTIPQENGVYQVTSGAWSRAAGFNTWGNFIGALLYVQEGQVNRATNWESTAAPLGSLFDLTSATSGNTPLYFKPESSIPLFLNKIKYGVDLVGSLQMDVPGADLSHVHIIDGVPLAVGNHVYNTDDNEIYTVDRVDPDGVDVSVYTDQIDVGDFLSVVAGFNYGNTIIKIVAVGDDPSTTGVLVTTELNEAIIQKNTVNKTYISPFIGAQSGMVLKLLNGKTVHFNGETADTNWIKINDINTELWYVTHDTLTTPLLSASVSDASVPYKYELRSYFKTSDENPFYCYEKPFITLEVNGDPYIIAGALETYDVIDPILQETVEYLVNTDDPYNVVVEGNLTINNRKITLTGLYNQFQQLSWESYRWILVDQNGDTLQDTGLRYDKEMTVTFYGLEDKKQYAAILYVRDDANNLLTLIVYFGVEYPENIPTSGLSFDANFDCSTHSVVLNFGGYSYTAPSVDNGVTQITYKYVSDNIDAPGFYWDSSYNTLDNQLEIYDVINYDRSNNPQPLPLVDIYAPVGETLEYTGLSYSVAEGLNVSHSFKYDELSVSSDENQLSIDGNKLYLETQVKLTENYCGKFVSFELEDDNPQNSVQVELLVPEVFNAGNNHYKADMSDKRGFIQLKISKGENSIEDTFLQRGSSNFVNYSIDHTNKKFIIQHPGDLSGTIDPANEYHNYNIRAVRGVTRYRASLWYKKEIVGNRVYYLNSHYNLGNLGLTRSGDGPVGPVYWAENRGTLIYIGKTDFSEYKEIDATEGGINLTSSNVAEDGNKISDPEYMPKWPSDESSFYWNEAGLSDDSTINPDYWDDVPGFDLSGTENRSALYRYTIRPSLPYSEMSENSYIVSCAISDIETLKSSFMSLEFGSLGDTEIGIKGMLEGVEIIRILLTKTEGGN